MGALKPLLAAAALMVCSPANAEGVARWRPFVEEASQRFGVQIAWIERVMQAESGGRMHLDGRLIRSSAGAMGLMQIMPGTWSEMRSRLGLGRNPDDPRDNILAGTLYLRLMYERFGYPGLFAAYNAGPARYAEHLKTGRALPRETVAYLASTSGPHGPATPEPDFQSPEPLFVLRRSTSNKAVPAPPEPPASALFAIKADAQ